MSSVTGAALEAPYLSRALGVVPACAGSGERVRYVSFDGWCVRPHRIELKIHEGGSVTSVVYCSPEASGVLFERLASLALEAVPAVP